MKKTRRAIILYDLIAREYWGCHKLKDALERKGFEVKLYQWNFQYYKAIVHAIFHKPDVLIIPSCYSDITYRRVVMPFKKISKDLRILCMHNEQIGYHGLKEDYLIPTDPSCKNTMIHVAWGEYFGTDLVAHGVHPELVKTVGSVRLQESLAKVEAISREELAREYGLDPDKKWILYCDGGGALFYEMAQKGQRSSDLIGGTKELDEMILPYGEAYVRTIEVLNAFIEKHHQGYELIFKLHPGLKDIDHRMFDQRIRIVRNHTVYAWFRHVVANVVFQSTSILESDAMGVRSAVLKPVPLKYEVAGVMEYPACEDLEGLEKLILVGAAERERDRRIYVRYIGGADRDVVEALAAEIAALPDAGYPLFEEVGEQASYRKLFTSVLANLMFHFFRITGLLHRVQWPFAFAMNKYEHPYFKDKYI